MGYKERVVSKLTKKILKREKVERKEGRENYKKRRRKSQKQYIEGKREREKGSEKIWWASIYKS